MIYVCIHNFFPFLFLCKKKKQFIFIRDEVEYKNILEYAT